MLDRIPTQPGRVLVTPEDGSTPYYAVITMADEPTEEGTPPTKANLLSDATASVVWPSASAMPTVPTVDLALQRLNEKAVTAFTTFEIIQRGLI